MPPYKHVVFIQKIHWKSKTFVRFSFNKNKIIFFPDLWCYFSVSDSFSAGVCQHHICWLNNERLLGVKQLSRHQGLSNRTPVYYNNNNDLKSLVVSTLSQFQHNLVLKKESRGGYSQDRDMWQKKVCSTFIVISKSHAGHILESTYYVSYS